MRKMYNDSVCNFWFEESNSSIKHRIDMLNILIIMLLRKHCAWGGINANLENEN